MVTQYIATRTIMEFCEEVERRTGARVSKRWWEQEGINLVGAAAAMASKMEETDVKARGVTDD